MSAVARATLIAIVVFSLVTAAQAQDRDLQIRVSARVSGKFVSPAGSEPPGFDVDLLRRFAAWYRVRTGREARLEFSYASTVPALLDAVQQGTADLGLGGVTETAERALVVDFSLATLPVRSVLVAKPGVLDAARWRQQLPGLRLGATVGSTNADEVDRIAASIGGVRVDNSFTTNEAVFAALAANPRTLDAALVDLPQFWTTGKQNGLVLVDSVGEPQDMAFVLRKGAPLKAQLDQFLDTFTHSSDYFNLIRRYFGQDAEQMVRLSRGGR
jgi:ABC-type amino acid transport substrate-binding protein